MYELGGLWIIPFIILLVTWLVTSSLIDGEIDMPEEITKNVIEPENQIDNVVHIEKYLRREA